MTIFGAPALIKFLFLTQRLVKALCFSQVITHDSANLWLVIWSCDADAIKRPAFLSSKCLDIACQSACLFGIMIWAHDERQCYGRLNPMAKKCPPFTEPNRLSLLLSVSASHASHRHFGRSSRASISGNKYFSLPPNRQHIRMLALCHNASMTAIISVYLELKNQNLCISKNTIYDLLRNSFAFSEHNKQLSLFRRMTPVRSQWKCEKQWARQRLFIRSIPTYSCSYIQK